MGITCNSVRCGFVFLFLALSVFVFSSGTAMAGSLEDAAYTLNAVGASMIPDNFIEISSIQCSSQALPGYTSEKSSSLGQNEWDALDLNPGTQFNLKIINEIGAVQYTPIAYIPVINSSSVEGISLYARKKYIAIVSPDGNLSYRYENNTIIRENMLFNLSIYSKDSAIYNASINNIPVYTGQMTNQSGLVIEKNIMAETTGSGVFNPVVINKTRYSIKLYNNSLISPDRLIELPVENNSAFLNILHRNTFKRIDIKNESIIINSSSDFSADRRILGYIVLENAEHAKAIIAENNTIAFEAMQFIGKIPITKIGNNYAIPVLNRTIDRNLYGNAVGIIPLLSMEYIYDNSVPGSAKASCEIKFAKKQILKGIEIVPTTAMQIDRVIAGDREIPINKALSPGKKQTIYYNEPAYADKLNIEFSAPTMQCSQSEIYQKCQQFCSLGRNSAMNLGILGAGNGCMTNCTQKSCFKADIGFSEIMTKPAEVKIEVNPELDFIRDPYLQAYTQFFSAETIDIKGTLETNTHTCQGGARQNCLDIDIIPCEEKRFTRNLVQECRHWEAACPGGWAMKASSCRQGERCELNTVGRVLLGALGSIAFGGIHNFWSALAYSSAETVLTDVIHLPSWLASAVMSTIAPINLDGTTKWTFRFTGDFFTKVAVRYAQDQAYQQIMKSLGAGNFLEKLLANVLVSWVNIVGNNIADSEMRKAFFKGNWVGVNKERLFRVIPTDALIKTTLIELTGGVKTDSWVVMLAAAYASSELTGMIYKDRSEMIKTLENKEQELSTELEKGKLMIVETDRSGAKYTYIKLTDQEKAVLTEELRTANIKLRTLQLDSGSLNFQYMKNLEAASATFAADMMSIYLQQQVVGAGEEGNSVQCEREYIKDSQFRPVYKAIGDCAQQSTISQIKLKTQANADVDEKGAVGYFLCDEYYEPLPDNTSIVLRIKNSAGEVVAEYNSKTSNVMKGIENFNLKNIVLPSVPGRYLFEFSARTDYNSQVIEGNYKYEIDIVSPSIKAALSPKEQCGSGEQLDYMLNISSSIDYPIIYVEKNKYIPFSMPYIAQKKVGYRFETDYLSLKDISPSCDITELVSWNQAEKKFDSLDTNAYIEPGKGYFVKSSNNCAIIFNSERFSGYSRQIKFEQVNDIALIGSVGYSLYPEAISCYSSQLGYKIKDNIAVQDQSARKPIYFIEASPADSPTPPEKIFDQRMNYAERIEPGKAYWVYSAESCSLQSRSSSPPFIGKDIAVNITNNVPEGWSMKQTENMFYNSFTASQFSYVTNSQQAGHDAYSSDLLRIGETMPKEYQITPNPADYLSYKKYNLSINIENIMAYVNSSVDGSYSITKQDPVINITEISRNGKQKEYRLSILNKQNPGCQPKTYYIRVQAPDYWNARITDSRNDKIMAEIEPGSVDESTILVNPRSVSSDINILVTSAGEKDIIRYEDLFDQVMTTRAADLAIGSLYFINPDAQANERIGMMINNSILYPGAVNNIAFGDIVSLSQNKDYLFFIEDRSGSRYLKKMSKTNYNISIVTNTSASIIAASERHAYFYDNNTLFRIRLNDSYITITAFAENITAIESDENNLYFLQANVLKKISSTMQTIGEFEYISDIAVDDKYIYLAVNHSIYGKIIKIDKNSLEISTVAAYPGIDRIAVDERWIYLSAGYEIKRIEKITKTYEQKIRIDVPGHSKPVIVLDNKEGVPGEVVSFPIQVTNTNYNSPESSMNFYIKNVVINNSLSRSYNGFRCYDDSRLISNSMSGIVYLCLNSSIESNFSSSYDFTVVIGTEDQSMDAEVNGKYIIKYQGPPFVQVIGDKIKDSSIFNRETAVIKKGQDAWYDIEITNTEARSNSFGFNVSGIMFQAYDKYRRYPIESISLGYRTYDKKEKISLRLDTGLIDYSGKNYTLSIYNIENPVVHADANLEALITPCNFNNVCNIEDNENSSNCADCISALKCNGECDTTTEKGIEFSVLNKIDGLYVCKKDSANYWCINNSMNNDCGIGKECICKSNSNTCAVSCVDNADYYYLLGRENNTLLQSPFFMFRCPTCLGNIYDDFNQWLLKKKTAHMTADYCAQSSGFTYQTVCTATREQYISCRDSIAFILESAKEINASISSARSGQSDCAGAAAGTAGFMNSMDDIYNDNCRLFQGYGNLRILDIKQNNITIENKGTTDYYGIVSCSYNTQQAGHDADNGNIFSECSQVIAGKQMILNITLSPGIYNLFCAANGSWFDDCRASSEHSSMRTLVDIPYPDTSLQIIDYNYNQDTDDIIVDMRNNGKQGEAFVSCALSSEAYSEARELNTSSTIGMNKIVSLKLSGILPAGTWSIERCSVYYNDALQHTLSLGKRFSIGKPVIKIISPGNKTAVKDTIYIEMAMVSAAAIYIDDNYIGQTDEDRFLINTKQLSNSMHVIAAVECNRHGCSNDSISVYIVNGINENDFVTMPEYRSYSVRKGNEMNISFIIKNIGQFEDSYSIYYDMKPDWVSSTSESDTVIGPGESRMINFYLSVNDSNPALLEFSAYSRTSTQTKKAFVNFTIGDNMPPDIKSASAIPYEVNRGETVAFYADITDDNENNITAIACSDKECNKELCRMSIEQVLGRELYQCSYLVDMEKGLHSFYILANDSNDMTISFGENFFVKEFMQKINSFSIEPYEQNIELIAGERYMVEFALNNTGNQKDRYDISYNIDTWYASLFVDYQRKNSVLLEPGQAVMIGLEIDAPVAEIGEKAILELSVRSASGSMKTGHANMAVNDIINRPPEINELYTMSYANAINQPVVFIVSVIDPDNDQITANICSNRMCNELLCAIEAGTCSKIFNSTGIFQYYLVAEDSHGLRTISSAHNFEVKDSTDTGARNIISESIKINSSSYLLQEAPVNVIDDNNSYWTASSLPAWLIIDLNRTTAVTGFGIFSESAARPKGFRIDISENCINYTTAYNTNSGQYKTGWIKQFFSPANGRCVKLYITASESNADYASVALFEVYASTASQATESQQTRANLPEYNDNNASRSDIADYAVQEYNKTDYTLFIIIVIAAIVILAVIFRNSIKQLIGRQRLKNYYDS